MERLLIPNIDYKRTQKVLATCPFCYGEDDSLPKAPIVAMGTRAYLSCTLAEELVDGHCLIVPIAHHLSTLEGDDDTWDEIRACRTFPFVILYITYTPTEPHEVSHAHVCRRGQRRSFLRNSPFYQSAKAYVYRVCAAPLGIVRTNTRILQGLCDNLGLVLDTHGDLVGIHPHVGNGVVAA